MTTISASSNEPDLSIRWPALVKFFRLPWFSRVWVLQEVVMAREARAFFCGHEVLWTHLRKATSLMFASPFTHLSRGAASGLRSVAMIDKWRSWKVEKPPVALPIMVETRSKEATMAIDKFLGVLALLDLDYPANAAIEADGHPFKVLSCAHATPKKSSLQLPSWVPDWTESNVPFPLYHLDAHYTAGGEGDPTWGIDGQNQSLSILGAQIDEVVEIGDVYNISTGLGHPSPGLLDSQALLLEAHNRMKAWLQQCVDIYTRHSLEDASGDVFWRLLVCNRNLSGAIAEAFAAFYNFYMDTHLRHHKAPAPSDLVQRISHFQALFKHWCVGRAFFATASGRVGWEPQGTRPSDAVCLFYGAEVPYLLSKTDREAKGWRMLGECYVHGYMEGQALAIADAMERTFKIV